MYSRLKSLKRSLEARPFKRIAISRDVRRHLTAGGQVVQCTDDSGFEWVSEGDDPWFVLTRGLPLPGWQMLEVAVDHDQAHAIFKLYLDAGSGFEEDRHVLLPLKGARISKRLFFVPIGLRRMRIDPLESCGRFSVKHLRFVWVTRAFAHDRIAQRLANVHHKWRSFSKPDVLKRVDELARARKTSWAGIAFPYYDETFAKRTLHGRSYRQWLQGRTWLDSNREGMARSDTGNGPRFSLVLPVYDPAPEWLEACLGSVLIQTYGEWELCIADDGSTNPAIRKLLRSYAQRDSRVRVVWRESNGHICAASNTALEQVTGDYVGFLDHDDVLAPGALMCVVAALEKQHDAKLLYSDEDKIDEAGERFEPHFKPRWNPDLLLSQNYIGHFCVISTDLVKAVGGFREGYEGSQDHDLLLRVTEGLSPSQIVHVPGVLYHWRAGAGSTARDSAEKSYTSRAGLAAVRDCVARREPGAEVVQGALANTYRVIWPLPNQLPLVSLIVPTRNRVRVLKPCVDAILQRTRYPNFELLIVDNDSDDPETLAYFEEVKADPRVRIIEWHRPFNFSQINNVAVRQADGEIVGLVNNDVEPINEDWLEEMVRQAVRPEIGCVGAKLYYPDGTVQHGGVILGIGGVAGHSHKHFSRNDPGYFSRLFLVQNLSAVTGACLLVKKQIYQEVGGFDEVHLPVAFNDVDFCLKVRDMGYRNLWTPYAELYHHESASRGGEDTAEKRARAAQEIHYMQKRWGEALYDDPAYNPNLTLVHEDFSLR